jgi:hypothetical protein
MLRGQKPPRLAASALDRREDVAPYPLAYVLRRGDAGAFGGFDRASISAALASSSTDNSRSLAAVKESQVAAMLRNRAAFSRRNAPSRFVSGMGES